MSSEEKPPAAYRSLAEIEALVESFESGALPISAFKHRAHVAVAFWYLRESDLTAALARMRAGILNFLRRHSEDLNVYNETVTLFWLRRVLSLLDERDLQSASVEVANELIEACREPGLIYRYYSRELLATEEARAAWVEPDLRPLDF